VTVPLLALVQRPDAQATRSAAESLLRLPVCAWPLSAASWLAQRQVAARVRAKPLPAESSSAFAACGLPQPDRWFRAVRQQLAAGPGVQHVVPVGRSAR